MSREGKLQFPDLVLLRFYEDNEVNYLKAVWNIFEEDFIINTPQFGSNGVHAKSFPEEKGLHGTFHHITSEGIIEAERTRDIPRMERIRFPKYMIESHPHQNILVWQNIRGRQKCTLIYNDNERYLVVLHERSTYFLLCTAYPVNEKHSRKKLLKEYEASIKAETAQGT